MALSIIIVSFNTKELLQQCLESLEAATIRVPFEIIIVDNASVDGSQEMIKEQFKDIFLIENSGNLMFARANNQGIAAARGRYLLLLNSDTIVQKSTIESLIDFLNEHPKAAAVGPKVLNLNGTLQSKGFSFPSIRGTILNCLGIGKKTDNMILDKLKSLLFPNHYWHENDVISVGWVAGCCFMVRKSAIDLIGGLCEDLFFYGEEVEWCYRVVKANYEIWYLPTVAIEHIGGASSSKKIDECLLRKNYKLLCEKTIGIRRVVISSCMTILIRYSLYLALLIIGCGNPYRARVYTQVRGEMAVLKYLISKNANDLNEDSSKSEK